MSAELMSAAIDTGARMGLTAKTTMVLAVLGDHADDNGVCWPSAAWIGHRLNMHERSVIRCMATLSNVGLIDRKRTNKSALTTLNIDAILGHKDAHKTAWKRSKYDHPKAPESPTGDIRISHPGEVGYHTPVRSDITGVSHKPSVEPPYEPSAPTIRKTHHQRGLTGAPDPATNTSRPTHLRAVTNTTPSDSHDPTCRRCDGTGIRLTVDEIGLASHTPCRGEAA